MTIDDVMALADKYADAYLASVLDDDGPSDSSNERNELRAAILALLDAEAEACAEVCDAQGREWDSDAQQTLKNYAAFSAQAIRARIDARNQ